MSDWLTLSGRWAATPGGMRKTGADGDGLIMLLLPVLQGAVRINVTGSASGPAGDLSLFLGIDDGDISRSWFFGFGSSDNTCTVLRVPGAPAQSVQVPLIEPGKKHRITVVRDEGRVEFSVDGQVVFSQREMPDGFAGPYLGLYSWQETVFSHVKIEQRDYPGLAEHVSHEALEKERNRGAERLDLKVLADTARGRATAQRHLRRRGLWPRQRLIEDQGRLPLSAGDVPAAATVVVGPGTDLYAVAALRSEGTNGCRIEFRRSGDHGRNWDTPVTVVSSPRGLDDCGLLRLHSGDMVTTWSQAAHGQETASPEFFLSRSSDKGRSWSPARPAPVHSPHGPLELPNGDLLYLGLGVIEDNRVLAAAVSADTGESWKIVWQQGLASGELAGLRDPHALYTDDGRILAVFRMAPTSWQKKGYLYRYNQIWQMESRDGGRHWTVPTITPMRGVTPHLSNVDQDTIVCSYTFLPDEWGDDVHAQVRQEACISRNGGRSWESARQIVLRADTGRRAAGWPATVRTGGGMLYTLFLQQNLGESRVCLNWVAWPMPVAQRLPPCAPGLEMSIEDPVVVSLGPAGERRWGWHQFPHFRFDSDGNPVVVINEADDGIKGILQEPHMFRSGDGGRTWTALEERERRFILPGVQAANGSVVSFTDHYGRDRDRDDIDLAGLDLQASAREIDGNYTVDLYRFDDVPAQYRALAMKRLGADGRVTEYAAPLRFPGLCSFSFVTGSHSEKGEFELAEPKLRHGYFILNSCYSTVLPNGDILNVTDIARKYDARGIARRGVFCLVSGDNGKSWSYRSTVALEGAGDGRTSLGEASITRTGRGNLLCVWRTEPGGAAEIPRDCYYALSRDDGVTWSLPRRLHRYGVWPRLLTLGNGITVCVSGRPGVFLRASADPEAGVWSRPVMLREALDWFDVAQDGTCGYTDLFPVAEDRFLVVYSDFYHRDRDWVLHKAIKVREVRISQPAR